MNIKFMSEFYERFYDDPVFVTIGQKEEYKEIKRRIKEGEEKLRKIIGEIESDTWELFEDIMTAQYEYVTLVAKEMYLKGAEDREKMLE